MNSQENPYLSPQAIVAGFVTEGPDVRPYASGHARALWVVSLFVLTSVLLLVFLLLLVCAAADIESLQARGFADSNPASDMVGLIVLAPFLAIAFLATPIAFLMWVHRAYRNLPALAAERLRYSPGWAVGYYFIPFLNLVRPCQVMCEVWRQSDPATLRINREMSRVGKAQSAAIVGWWWALSLLMLLLYFAAELFCDESTLSDLSTVLWLNMVIVALILAAATAAAVMVYRIEDNQSRRHALIAGQPDAPAHSTPTAGPPGLVD